jgi:hypothetical protein
MSTSLTEFFREKKQRAEVETAGVDWSNRLSEWLAAVNALYQQIDNWLAEPLSQGSVQRARQRKQLTEDHFGTYEIDDLVLKVGDESVVFSPRGRNVAGAIGRIDVRGESGESMLVLQPGRWSVVKSKYPTLKLVTLDEAALGEVLRGVMRQ